MQYASESSPKTAKVFARLRLLASGHKVSTRIRWSISRETLKRLNPPSFTVVNLLTIHISTFLNVTFLELRPFILSLLRPKFQFIKPSF